MQKTVLGPACYLGFGPVACPQPLPFVSPDCTGMVSPRCWLCLVVVFLAQCRAQQHQRGGSPERSGFFAPVKQDATLPADQRNYAFFRNALLSGRIPYRNSAALQYYGGPERRGRSDRHRMSFYDMGLEKRFPEVDQRGFHEDIFEESFGDFSPVK